MPSQRTIRRSLSGQSTYLREEARRSLEEARKAREPNPPTTMHAICIAESNKTRGNFEAEEKTTIVGAGAEYGKSAGPWADETVHSTLSAPDTTGYAIEDKPFRMTGGDRSKFAAPTLDSADELAKVLARMSVEELTHNRNKALGEMKTTPVGDIARLEELQGRADVCQAEIDRRRQA